MSQSTYILIMSSLLVSALMAACQGSQAERTATMLTGGNPQRGERLIRQYGCGACHVIPGVPGASGLVAPPLTRFAQRSFIAGQVPNTPNNLVEWIVAPASIVPGTAMPALGLTLQQARDVTAYLYTLR